MSPNPPAKSRRTSIALTLSLCISALVGCQTPPHTEKYDNTPLDQLNPPPEQLPVWRDNVLESVGDVVSYLPKKSLQILGIGSKKNSNRSSQKIPPEKPNQTALPTPTPPATATVTVTPTPTPTPTPTANQTKVKPKVKLPSRPRSTPQPKEPPAQSTSLSPSKGKDSARNDILRGKIIQESPLGPRQPIELYQ